MDKKPYFNPSMRFLSPQFEKSFLGSTRFDGAIIEDAEEEEWTF